MSRPLKDPLRYLPDARAIEARIRQEETVLARLRILLDVAQRMEATEPNPARQQGVRHGR